MGTNFTCRCIFSLVEVDVDYRALILSDIDDAREDQVEDFGEADYNDDQWVAIFGEEFGSVCAVLTRQSTAPIREELREQLIQFASVVVAWLEDIESRPTRKCPMANDGVLTRTVNICYPCEDGRHQVCANAINPATPCTCAHTQCPRTEIHIAHRWNGDPGEFDRLCQGVEEQPKSCCGRLPSEHLCRVVCP